MTAPRSLLERMETFDRRWIFLVMALAIVLPIYFPIDLPIKPSPMTKAAFATVEDLHEGDTVLVSIDLDPASTAELEPYFRSVMLQLKRKHVKMVICTLWYAAPPLVERWIRESIDAPIITAATTGYAGLPDRAYEKNLDYVYLGFREGKQNVMLRMGEDIAKTFDGRTADGTAFDQVPVLKGIRRLTDFKLMVLISAGSPGAKEWVQFVQSRYNLRMVTATTAVSTTDLAPYFPSGQLLGLVAGLSGAAEYEKLVGKSGFATPGAAVLNMAHGVIILAIVLGNVVYFLGRRRRKRRAP